MVLKKSKIKIPYIRLNFRIVRQSDARWCERSGNLFKNYIKGSKKRTEEDDERFAQSFEKMVLMAQQNEGR